MGVVTTHFGGSLPGPQLTWSNVFTDQKFGRYDPIRRIVMISCTLGRADVRKFVRDSAMHHELPHKKLGVNRQDGRMKAHPPASRQEQRRLDCQHEAEVILRKLKWAMISPRAILAKRNAAG